MTYADLVAYIKAGVPDSWSAEAARDAKKFLIKNREAIRDQMDEYEAAKLKAGEEGLEEHLALLEKSQNKFIGYLVREGSAGKPSSVKEGLKEALEIQEPYVV